MLNNKQNAKKKFPNLKPPMTQRMTYKQLFKEEKMEEN